MEDFVLVDGILILKILMHPKLPYFSNYSTFEGFRVIISWYIKIVNGYLGYLAPFLEKQLITISYNFEITQPHKPRKMQNLQFFQLLKAF